MSNNQFLSNYIYLAEACYADFSKYLKENGDYNEGYVINNIKNLKMQNGKGLYESLAKLVTSNYKVVAHYTNRDDESGFSGTLFQGKDSTPNAGKYVIAMRGTEPGYTDIWATDISDIVHDGLAHHQIVDIYHF